MVTVYILSDSSGETAELVAKSALSQFEDQQVELCRLPKVLSADHIKELFQKEIRQQGVIVYTLVLREAKQALIEEARRNSIPIYDVLGDLVSKFETIFHSPPLHEPGLRLKVDESYFNRMDAIHFAIKYDDGQNLNSIDSADVILLGVSGTGKTPCCMYLAQHNGLRAANMPIVLGIDLVRSFKGIDKGKIIGLVCNPYILQSLRHTRASTLQMDYSLDYCDFEQISKEIDHSKRIFKELKCEIVDMTNKPVEETAVEIVAKIGRLASI